MSKLQDQPNDMNPSRQLLHPIWSGAMAAQAMYAAALLNVVGRRGDQPRAAGVRGGGAGTDAR